MVNSSSERCIGRSGSATGRLRWASLATRLAAVGRRLLWTVYLVRCADGTLYCGIARDVTARLRAHDAGTGARYTRGRGPLELLVTRRCYDHGLALRIEHAVKRLTRAEKLELAHAPSGLARLVRRVQRARPTSSMKPPISLS